MSAARVPIGYVDRVTGVCDALEDVSNHGGAEDIGDIIFGLMCLSRYPLETDVSGAPTMAGMAQAHIRSADLHFTTGGIIK